MRVNTSFCPSQRVVEENNASGITQTWSLTSYRKFVYDGWNLVAEFEQDGLTGLDKLARTYAWGQDLGGGIGGLLSITTYTSTGAADKAYLPLFDGAGNVMGLADAASGNVVASYEYDPFGNLLSATGDSAALAANPFRFSTKYFDAETGLYYYGYRYYSPQLGRWMTRDPMAEEGGVNVYAFVGNDPINSVDTLGLSDQSVVGPYNENGRRVWNGIAGDGWKVDSVGNYSYYNVAAKGWVVPCIVCHGRDGNGRLPGLTLTDSFVGGVWYHSGSAQNVMGNYWAGAARSLGTAVQRLGNFAYKLGVGLVGTVAGKDWMEEHYDVFDPSIDNQGDAIANAAYAGYQPNSNLYMSGEVGGDALASYLLPAGIAGASKALGAVLKPSLRGLTLRLAVESTQIPLQEGFLANRAASSGFVFVPRTAGIISDAPIIGGSLIPYESASVEGVGIWNVETVRPITPTPGIRALGDDVFRTFGGRNASVQVGPTTDLQITSLEAGWRIRFDLTNPMPGQRPHVNLVQVRRAPPRWPGDPRVIIEEIPGTNQHIEVQP